jgi:hypothetical protein
VSVTRETKSRHALKRLIVKCRCVLGDRFY